MLARRSVFDQVSREPEEEAPRALASLPRARAAALLVCGSLLSGFVAAASGPFETVPDQSPSSLLPATLSAGSDFHVMDPVPGDGLMHLFLIDSRFGKFAAYGRAALELRVREINALTELARTSNVGIVAGGVEHGVESELKTAFGVVTNPVGVVTGIPKGIAHLFHGYTAQGQEILADAGRAGNSLGGAASARNDVRKGEDAAKRYAERYLGVTAAERRWYRRLGVSPYTDNTVLRDAVRKAARTEAVGSFGVKFAGLPTIPGNDLTQRAVDAIYNEDPAAVRARTRKTLAGYGMSPGEIEGWLNAPLLNPARQVVLLTIAEQLGGVAGRGELFRHSLGLKTNAEVQVYLLSAGMLVAVHRSHPLASIVPEVRLPSARRADGRVIVCGSFEAVYWTQEVAKAEEQLRTSLLQQSPAVGRELWLAGTLSDRARSELRARDWELHAMPAPSGETAAH
jgi:hypothetical protein